MRVIIRVNVYEENYLFDSNVIEREVDVKAEPQGLQAIPWEAVAAGLVQSALDEALAKVEGDDAAGMRPESA